MKYLKSLTEEINKNISYSEYIAGNLDKSIEYSEYLAEHVEGNIAYSEYICESTSYTRQRTIESILEKIKIYEIFRIYS